MKLRRSHPRFALALVGAVLASTALAQPRADTAAETTAGAWKLESVKLANGQQFRGLITGEGRTLDFIEVVQPPGRAMYLVVRPLDARAVVKQNRLPPDDRQRLLERIAGFRNRAAIEAGRMDDVSLATIPKTPGFAYQGPWFQLTSSADEETTRRVVVRLEQVFRAYRQVLPPRVTPPRVPLVKLFGTVESYQAHLAGERADLEQLAYYSPRLGAIVAGSDLADLGGRLAQARAANAATQRSLEELRTSITARLAQRSAQLVEKGFSSDDIRDELTAQRRAWEEEIARGLREVNEAERRNEARFNQAAQRMLQRLQHEALHAWLEHGVYPAEAHSVPRWLHEGLAQIFEHAQFDGDLLRIDAPATALAKRLKADLAGPEPVRLADLLLADDASFLGAHGGGVGSERLYLYAWGLAWHLAFEEQRLHGGELQAYVSREAAALSPLARFEKLVGQPLPAYEARWRAALGR